MTLSRGQPQDRAGSGWNATSTVARAVPSVGAVVVAPTRPSSLRPRDRRRCAHANLHRCTYDVAVRVPILWWHIGGSGSTDRTTCRHYLTSAGRLPLVSVRQISMASRTVSFRTVRTMLCQVSVLNKRDSRNFKDFSNL